MPKWKLEEDFFDKIAFKDLRTGKTAKWPRQKPTDQIAFEAWLDKVVDIENGRYYPKKDEDGKVIMTTPDNVPKHTINTIIRLKRKDNSEYLPSKGHLTGHDGFGEEVKHCVPWLERWDKTHFNYEKGYDPKRKSIVNNCMGPGNVEIVYTLPFDEANLKSLYDKRESDNINWIIKDEQTGTPKQVAPEPNINDTFKLFLKPFSYLFNADYITPQMKAQYRQEAIDQGFLAAPNTTITTTTTTATPPKAGTYS